MSQSIDSTLDHIKTAFDYAQLNYFDYSLFYVSEDTPSQVEQLPLGIYELLLSSFIYRPIPPTIIENSERVEQHELAFEIEILPSPFPEDATLSDTEIEHAQELRQKSVKLSLNGDSSTKALIQMMMLIKRSTLMKMPP